MTPWPEKPMIYQINTWVWLDTLSRDYHWPVTLENVPDAVLDELATLNADAIWLMGVWTRSSAARASALRYASQYKGALPDLTHDDVIGSAYAVGSYNVDEHLGGRHGLAHFRERLAARGLKLILDYVPNHVAIDHAWVRVHPDYLILGTPRDLEKHASNFFTARDATGRSIVVAHGRDPHFAGWVDTAQVNAFSPAYRKAALETLRDIANQCDGVRCDMAMLLCDDIFGNTWQGLVSRPLNQEFWPEIIPQVRQHNPDFKFIAEVYWDMEARLLAQGFDYAYDKRLYDRIRDGKITELREHLLADINFQKHLVRFIENHDEERAAESLGLQKSKAAAVLICTLPGATLLHDGQLIGRRVKLPVQIGRQPYEPANTDLKAFYTRLLAEARADIYRSGEWRQFKLTKGKDDSTFNKLVAYGWRNHDEKRLIVVNLTDNQAQAHVHMEAWTELDQHDWHLDDILNGDRYLRDGDYLEEAGLYVDLKPFQAHLFRFERA